MTTAEVAGLLDESRVVICATNGVGGWPHLMPLWYVVRDGEIWSWTYARSQKVRNLERDPRATLQIEDGASYDQLRGVMIEAETRSTATATWSPARHRVARPLRRRAVTAEIETAVAAQAAKRVALRSSNARVDHRKLAGAY